MTENNSASASRRYVIIGAGAIGATLAAQYEQAGIRSILVARGRQLEAIRANGLRVRRPAGDDVVQLATASGPGDLRLTPADVLVLATKTQDAEAALAEWAWQPVAGGGVAADLPILTFQNGLITEDLALRRFSRVYAVSIGIAASYLEPGVVVSPSFPIVGVLWLGRYPDAHDELQDEFVADLTAAGYESTSVPNVSAWKARKLLGNVNNGLDVLDGSDEERAEARRAIVAETAEVLATAGVAVAEHTGPFALRIESIPGHTAGKLSTWQSFARGASSEVDYLNGEVVLIARRAGIEAPLNERLQRILGAQAQAGSAPGTHTLSDLLIDSGVFA
ncbi:ketopantoate reductase family protein [Microbacteriaceae bacterium VKM Ac-2854]|nr:ketopantoate reductase family protein [Microbacteriaceae bacterium VKM Ac-2854]